eukprot:Anaeramoba_flamelloidesc35835_g1_i1.p1 GENE.c35835_g1_i1~~c35835_g1_i1.p1  ORF type:complete len:315 (+),score=60.79 c35835_g1_i1:146-1090(+)
MSSRKRKTKAATSPQTKKKSRSNTKASENVKLKKEMKKVLQSLSDPKRAAIHQRFFKTGKGEYGEGDIFYGLRMPQIHHCVKEYKDRSNMKVIQLLIENKVHEIRMFGLLLLVEKWKETTKKRFKNRNKKQKKIIDFYLKNTKRINNWDLVDLTAKILGEYLLERPRDVLFKLVKSDLLWDRRISIIATHPLIKKDDYKTTTKLCEMCLNDEHDLIHKATGWMLREIGKRNIKVLYKFLDKYAHVMPRVMLRYSLEKVPLKKKKKYMEAKKKRALEEESEESEDSEDSAESAEESSSDEKKKKKKRIRRTNKTL